MNKFPPSGPFMLLQTTQAQDHDCATYQYTTLSTQEKLRRVIPAEMSPQIYGKVQNNIFLEL